jgi:hypothetical protein
MPSPSLSPPLIAVACSTLSGIPSLSSSMSSKLAMPSPSLSGAASSSLMVTVASAE